MGNRKLVSYIREQLRKGYSISNIKSALIRSGYSPYDINQAFSDAYRHNEIKHIIHLSPTTMIALLGGFLALIVISTIIFLNINSSPDYLLDLNIREVKSQAYPGTEISFIIKALNLGSSKRYDINLQYDIISKKTYETIKTETEAIAVGTTTSFEKSIRIPQDADIGDYLLRVTAIYQDGNKAPPASMPIKVIGSGTALPEVPLTENRSETADEKEEPQKHEEPDKPQEPETQQPAQISESSEDVLDKVKSVAKTDPSGAAKYCVKASTQSTKDLCYLTVGQESREKRFCNLINDERTSYKCLEDIAKSLKDPKICSQIQRDNWRDNCYVSFITTDDKDFTVCDKIVNIHIKQSCDAMKQLYDLNPEDLSYYQSLLNETLLNFELS